jgi:hypothetical protein
VPQEFYLSDIFINITLALSSNFKAGPGQGGAAQEASRVRTRHRFASAVRAEPALANITSGHGVHPAHI